MPRTQRSYAIALAALAWFAVLLQGYLSVRLAIQGGKSFAAGIEVFFSYFTVLTNTLICVSLTAALVEAERSASTFWRRPELIGGLAASIAFVGLSYHVLLRHVWNPQGYALVADLLLHYAVPISYVVYWWLSASKALLSWLWPLWWALYPTLYLAYALARGAVVGSYPYAFIDAQTLGYARTLANAVGLLFVFIVIGCIVVAAARSRARSWTTPRPGG